MAKYTGKTITVSNRPETISGKFSDLTSLQPAINDLPESERAKIGDIRLEKNAIAVITPQIGEIKFAVTENSPAKIVLQAVGSPIPLTMGITMDAKGSGSTDVTTVIEVDIPMMLRPLIGPQIQKAADQFGNLIATLAN